MGNPFQLYGESVQTPKARRVSFDTWLKLGAALIASVPSLYVWTGNHPLGRKLLAATTVLVFAWIAQPTVTEAIRWSRQKIRDRGFARREDQRLREFLPRFERFISMNDGRAIVCILNSMGGGWPTLPSVLISYPNNNLGCPVLRVLCEGRE